jgi:pimeloyl-ACP methyl ester carboxylesterase
MEGVVMMKRNRLLNGLKKFFTGLCMFLFVLSLTGILYQTAAAESDKKNFPPPGNLIDVGGFKMHIDCVGKGSPTVILDAMSAGFSSYWAWVQPEVAKQVRVCAYDRAGFGWSENDPDPESPQRTARNLHILLTNAGIEGPFVMVGHSKGGIYVREYAAMYPQDVVGLVLLDSSHPDQFVRHPEMLKGDAPMISFMPLLQTMVRIGLGRMYFFNSRKVDFADLPAHQHAEVAAIFSTQAYWQNTKTTMLLGASIFQQAHDLGSLGDLPLAVITRGEGVDENWREMQNELTALSTDSIHITVDGSTHGSLVFNPKHAHIVSQTILQVVNAVQTGKSLNQ